MCYSSGKASRRQLPRRGRSPPPRGGSSWPQCWRSPCGTRSTSFSYPSSASASSSTGTRRSTPRLHSDPSRCRLRRCCRRCQPGGTPGRTRACALRAAWRHKTPPPRPRASSSAQSASTRRLLKRGGARQRTSRSWWMSSGDCTRLLGRLRPVNAASELNRLESQSGPLSHTLWPARYSKIR